MTNKIFLMIIFSSLVILSGCTETSFYVPTKKVSDNNSGNNNQTVRGPTGGSTGGGIIIVEINGNKVINKNYSAYIEINGSKKLLKSGKINSNGEIALSDNDLSFEDFEKIQSGKAKLIVEAEIDGVKTVVNGSLEKDEA
jgi:hypothetical protein